MTASRVEALAAASNYLAVNLLYLNRFVAPGEPVDVGDARGFAPGHFGCVPGLNAIWANLSVAAERAGTGFVPIVGTGHGGAAWVAWTLLRDAALGPCLDRDVLDAACAQFGDESLLPHELFGPVPGVVWPSGELGYALAFAQGVAATVDVPVVAIVGDGEMETGPTLSALAGGSVLGPPPVVVVNANGYRMGARSWWSTLPDDGRALVEGFGWRHAVAVDGTDNNVVFADALTASTPTVVVYQSLKGTGIPDRGSSGVMTMPVHKLPVKGLSTSGDASWLRTWLDSYPVNGFGASGITADPAASRWQTVPTASRRDLGARPVHAAEPGAVPSPVRQFVTRVSENEPGLLVTAPDEAASNRVDIATVDVRELLSEPVTFIWAAAAAAAGRCAMWVTYEAFAPIVTTICAQYLRHAATAAADGRPARFPILTVTSLSGRNVASHQDVAWLADLERRHLGNVVFVVPPSAGAVERAADLACAAAGRATSCPVVVIDKYPTGNSEPADTIDVQALPGWELHRFGPVDADRRVVIVALGAAPFREATRAARLLAGPSVRCDIAALTWWCPGDDVTPVTETLFTTADLVASVANIASVTFDAVIDGAGNRVAHRRVWRPAPGTNEAARLAVVGIDAFAIAAALTGAGERAVYTAAHDSLVSELAATRTCDWYTDGPFDTICARFGVVEATN